MILSMTGFGEASRVQDGVTWHLEIRSLNNRYFKLNCKLPDQAAFLEAVVETRLRKALVRGTIYVNLQVRNMSAQAAYEINEVALASYIAHLRSLGSAAGDELRMTVDLATAMLLPGVAQPRQEDQQEQIELKRTAEQMLDEAVEKLMAMRTVEGRALADDLTTHLDRMAEYLGVVARRAPHVVVEYQQRLTERVSLLLADQKIQLEADTLAREVALFADRSDINEEAARLRSHISQFRDAMSDNGRERDAAPQVGRKLDFLSQEFLREVNTMGSKSNDADISRACVELKSVIDRIKEQVQNVV